MEKKPTSTSTIACTSYNPIDLLYMSIVPQSIRLRSSSVADESLGCRGFPSDKLNVKQSSAPQANNPLVLMYLSISKGKHSPKVEKKEEKLATLSHRSQPSTFFKSEVMPLHHDKYQVKGSIHGINKFSFIYFTSKRICIKTCT